MKISAPQLGAQLKRGLANIYWVTGDETLLVQEACDQIREAAKKQEFGNREVWHVEAGFDWQQVFESANSLSLFADRQLLELRLKTGKPAAKICEAIALYCTDPNPDTLTLITSPKLDAGTMRGKHFTAIEAACTLVQVWPVELNQFPDWISARLASKGLHADADALTLLCERVEGNLLAAQQEIDKLVLLADQQQITLDQVLATVGNSARYDVFNLVERMLGGDAAGSLRILRGLRAEGTDATQVLWVLAKETRTLLSVASEAGNGNINAAMAKARVWKRQQPLVAAAVRRLNEDTLRHTLKLAHQADLAIKGMSSLDAWDLLSDITLRLAGRSPNLLASPA
ncbi:MAG: DNA polymerase III subunit delta [Pseudomonadales bacterium]